MPSQEPNIFHTGDSWFDLRKLPSFRKNPNLARVVSYMMLGLAVELSSPATTPSLSMFYTANDIINGTVEHQAEITYALGNVEAESASLYGRQDQTLSGSPVADPWDEDMREAFARSGSHNLHKITAVLEALFDDIDYNNRRAAHFVVEHESQLLALQYLLTVIAINSGATAVSTEKLDDIALKLNLYMLAIKLALRHRGKKLFEWEQNLERKSNLNATFIAATESITHYTNRKIAAFLFGHLLLDSYNKTNGKPSLDQEFFALIQHAFDTVHWKGFENMHDIELDRVRQLAKQLAEFTGSPRSKEYKRLEKKLRALIIERDISTCRAIIIPKATRIKRREFAEKSRRTTKKKRKQA